MVEYFTELRRSLTDAYQNKNILLALLLQGLAAVFIAVLFGVGVIFAIGGATLTVEASALFAPWVGIVAVIALLLILFVVAWFDAGIYGMADAVVQGKKRKFFETRSLWPAFLLFEVIKGAASIIVALPLAVLAFFAFTGPSVALGVLAAIAGLFAIAAWIFLGFAFLFAAPAIIRHKIGAGRAIKRSFFLLFTRTKHVLLSGLMVAGLVLVFIIGLSLLTTPFDMLADTIGGFFTGLNVLVSIIEMLIQLFVVAVVIFFTLRMYSAADLSFVSEMVLTEEPADARPTRADKKTPAKKNVAQEKTAKKKVTKKKATKKTASKLKKK